MEVSNVAKKIKPSLTRQLFDKAAQYDDVIDLTLGDPDFATPPDICEAGCKAIMEGMTKYTANAGLIELREAVSERINKETGLVYKPENQIIITVGAMGALYLLIKSYINEGDEVIIPSPCWVNYMQMTIMSGGVPITINCDESKGFSLSIEAIENAITDKTKLIIINNPCNPTGAIYSKETLEALIKIAEKYNILIVSDEVYDSIVYNDAHFTSILDIPNASKNVVLVNSFSKRYAMTGWRVGYALGDCDIINAMTRFQENIAACCPQPSQWAAIQALKEPQDIADKMLKAYQERRDYMVSELNNIDKLSCQKPAGTFYIFINIKDTEMSSVDFAYSLLDSVGVAVVPGITYGDAGEGFIRIALTQKMDKLHEAVHRIKKFINYYLI